MRFCIFLAILVGPTIMALAADDPCQVRLILFVPSDVDMPAGYQERLDQTIKYTESFLRNGFRRWRHTGLVSPFRRDADGHAEVYVVRGTKTSAEYPDPSLRREAIASAKKKNGIDSPRQVWWVFVYKGDPPTKFRNYVGGFDPNVGGWSVCNFDTRPGKIDPADRLGTQFLVELTLKGMIHELGHGFQLPHIGPRRSDDGGNTLMGPNHPNYRRVIPKREERVYLSEATAAMLSQHPAFRGVPDNRRQLPKVNVRDEKYIADRRGQFMTVSGLARANVKPVYAIVADESDARPGEYWTKHYVGRVDEDGRYTVKITEPAKSNGTLKTWFVFENGAMTGDGRKRGKGGAISKPYRHVGKMFQFE